MSTGKSISHNLEESGHLQTAQYYDDGCLILALESATDKAPVLLQYHEGYDMGNFLRKVADLVDPQHESYYEHRVGQLEGELAEQKVLVAKQAAEFDQRLRGSLSAKESDLYHALMCILAKECWARTENEDETAVQTLERLAAAAKELVNVETLNRLYEDRLTTITNRVGQLKEFLSRDWMDLCGSGRCGKCTLCLVGQFFEANKQILEEA